MRATKILLSVLILGALPANLPAQEPAQFTAGKFTFVRPADWKWVVPSSPMRKAHLQVPGAEGTTDVLFFHFGPGQGGTLDANVERWMRQFSPGTGEPKPVVKKSTAEGTPVTYVFAEGVFQSGMPGGPTTPMENYALRGAILQDPEGGDVYVKMTGPKATVEKAEAEFQKMVEGAIRSSAP